MWLNSMQLQQKHLSAMPHSCTSSIRVLLLDLKMCFLIMIIILPCNSVLKSLIALTSCTGKSKNDNNMIRNHHHQAKHHQGKGSDNQQTGQSTSNTPPHSQQSNQPNRQTSTKPFNCPNTTSNKTPCSNTGSSSSTSSLKPYADLLGSDGKLKPEEKERRKHLGLCLVCGDNYATDRCPNHHSAQGQAGQAKSSVTSEAKTSATNSVSNPTSKEQGK